MKNRISELPSNQSYFVFGARGVGKSTLIKQCFEKIEHLFIDLLTVKTERKLLRSPDLLESWVLALPDTTKHVIIDEIQKIPELLNVVHKLIESTDKHFIMTGSSAKKLKHGAANLLAGRAFVKNLFPFSCFELDNDFSLKTALSYGLLPKLSSYKSHDEKAEFLRSYAHIYLKEEVWAEHLIRKLAPFQYFLEVAAQSNGKIINMRQIAKDVGTDDKTVAQYFSILEDTLIGFHLHAYHASFRKRLINKPKFYFFDTGIVRALTRTLSLPVQENTYEYGSLFEHFVILEALKLINYFHPDYRATHLRTYDDTEIDLVIERPGKPALLIEIKSAKDIRQDHLKSLKQIADAFKQDCEPLCFSRVDQAMVLDGITVLPWKEGLERYFLTPNRKLS